MPVLLPKRDGKKQYLCRIQEYFEFHNGIRYTVEHKNALYSSVSGPIRKIIFRVLKRGTKLDESNPIQLLPEPEKNVIDTSLNQNHRMLRLKRHENDFRLGIFS
jgi:hypothetical protein